MDEALVLSKLDGVGILQLNRPVQKNSLTTSLRKALLEGIEAFEHDDDIRFVVLTGSGGSFCAGADLKEGFGGKTVEQQIETEYKPILMAIQNSNKLYVAKINGIAAGIGAALALTCDLSIMAEDAGLYLAFAAIGLIPDGGLTLHLVQNLGYSHALSALIEGKHFDAQACLELRLVNKLVAADELDNACSKWLESLMSGAPLMQKEAKRLLVSLSRADLGNVVSQEAKVQGQLSRTEDFKEGVAAFLEKRKPRFSGR